MRCRFCKPEYQLRYLGEQAEIENVKKVIPAGRFVPSRMIEAHDGRSGVAWPHEDDRLAKRRIPLGERLLDGRIQIGPGLPETTQVLTEDRPGLREGRAARAAGGGL